MPQTLILEPGEFSLLKLGAGDPLPAWLPQAPFWTVTRAVDELSIICSADAVPYGTNREAGWRLLRLEGPFAFDQSGILASVLTPLAAADIGIMAVSTFTTDYVLVKDARLLQAVGALRTAGHVVRDDLSPLAPREVVF